MVFEENFKYFTFFTVPMATEVKTVTISEKRQITLPAAFSAFKKGGKALVIGRGDEIVVKPLTKANEEALLSEKALAEAWNSPEDEEAFSYLQK